MPPRYTHHQILSPLANFNPHSCPPFELLPTIIISLGAISQAYQTCFCPRNCVYRQRSSNPSRAPSPQARFWSKNHLVCIFLIRYQPMQLTKSVLGPAAGPHRSVAMRKGSLLRQGVLGLVMVAATVAAFYWGRLGSRVDAQ